MEEEVVICWQIGSKVLPAQKFKKETFNNNPLSTNYKFSLETLAKNRKSEAEFKTLALFTYERIELLFQLNVINPKNITPKCLVSPAETLTQ